MEHPRKEQLLASPIEQAAEMIGSNGGQSLPSEAPPGGPVGGSSVARRECYFAHDTKS